MLKTPGTLSHRYSNKLDIPIILIVSAVLLVFGLFLPVISLKELIFFKSTFSVLTGIVMMFHEGFPILGAIIFLFSVCFPILKISLLLYIWFFRVPDERRSFIAYWLGILGKWSMLDVFIVALTIIITKISHLVSAEARIGIYFFGGSILLVMIGAERIDHLLKKHESNS